ncbi:MAG: DUF1343 domain-containing protein [Myxococcales bacterium]|nr:DUF1343 domain-containing protein [Myxococcales bacterium]
MVAKVLTGLDGLLSGDSDVKLDGRRVALIANATSVTTDLVHAADRFAADFTLVTLFGPEHGIRGDAQDMISVNGARDATGLSVHSLYGSDEVSLSPTPESLEGVDVAIFDIQDVGSRYYTYVWTMVLAMRACAKANVAFVVLDRPNPIGGAMVEGGDIEDGYGSFVGLRSLPNRHGLTAGEIATWAAREEGLDLELTIVPLKGWQREMSYGDTGLPWVLPSPNMPTVETALVYPGMCLVEGTELSEGRGHTRPFEVAGAPFVDGAVLAALLAEQDLPGVLFRPLTFTPTFQKHAGAACGGVQQHVTDPSTYLPYKTGVAFVWAVHKLWAQSFSWRSEAYEFVDEIPAFDLLAGSSALRDGIEAGGDLKTLAKTWAEAETRFAEERQSWLMYP